jgi:hypothetical protein
MNALWLLLLFPLIWPFIAKAVWNKTITWQEMGLNIVIPVVVVTAVFFLGRAGKISDVELWNGQVTAKHVKNDEYERPYDCFCTTVSCGKDCETTVCQTCYEDRYTKTWWVDTTLGDITIRHLDQGSKSVWDTPDPLVYKDAYQGQPCSVWKRYDNYVKAVEGSLFNDANHRQAYEKYMGMHPNYPEIYNVYSVKRVRAVGVKLDPNKPEATIEAFRKLQGDMNLGLGNMLRTLGPTKQVNLVMLLVPTNDPNYRYALESHWSGGKKNDVTIILGITDFPKVEFVDVMTFGGNIGNEYLRTVLRDELTKIGTFDPETMLPAIEKTIAKNYKRPEMQKFEYLKAEIQPATWVMILATIISIVLPIGLTFWFHREDVI